MLPLSERILTLEQIAEYWSRETGGILTSDEIHNRLLAEFWQGQLEVTGPSGNSVVDHRKVLGVVSHQREQPGVLFIESEDERPPLEVMPDGSICVDATRYIVLPSESSCWTQPQVEDAYACLAVMSFDDFHESIRVALRMLSTTAEPLRAYCKAMDCEPPRFWFGKETGVRWNSVRERQAEVWFKKVAAGRKQKTKSEYFFDARKAFPDMPEKAFKRIWNKFAPPEWRRSGPVHTRRSEPSRKP